jgi:uncharacterized protein YaaQ
MAIEYVDSQAKIDIVAGADLSTHQYKFVKLSATGVILPAANTDVVIGVLQNSPRLGEVAEIAVSGVSKVKMADAVAVGKLVGITAAGLGTDLTSGTDATRFVVGQTVTASTANGDIVTVAVNCANPTRAA